MRTHTFGGKPAASGARAALSTTINTFTTDGATVASGIPLAQFSLRSMLAWYRERLENQRHRQELAMLTDEQLDDIGLSRTARDLEVSRSFWD